MDSGLRAGQVERTRAGAGLDLDLDLVIHQLFATSQSVGSLLRRICSITCPRPRRQR
jgi:hypothetical protein